MNASYTRSYFEKIGISFRVVSTASSNGRDCAGYELIVCAGVKADIRNFSSISDIWLWWSGVAKAHFYCLSRIEKVAQIYFDSDDNERALIEDWISSDGVGAWSPKFLEISIACPAQGVLPRNWKKQMQSGKGSIKLGGGGLISHLRRYLDEYQRERLLKTIPQAHAMFTTACRVSARL